MLSAETKSRQSKNRQTVQDGHNRFESFAANHKTHDQRHNRARRKCSGHFAVRPGQRRQCEQHSVETQRNGRHIQID